MAQLATWGHSRIWRYFFFSLSNAMITYKNDSSAYASVNRLGRLCLAYGDSQVGLRKPSRHAGTLAKRAAIAFRQNCGAPANF